MRGQHQLNNAAGVVMVLELLADRLPVTQQQLRQGLLAITPPPGRQQILTQPVTQILDVAHNVDSVGALADLLATQPCSGHTHAVVGMLVDKDLTGILARIATRIDNWHLGSIGQPRGAQAEQLREALLQVNADARLTCYPDISTAWQAATGQLNAEDRLIVFGSFYTVAEVLKQSV